MKYRLNFVSNSSSSSFILAVRKGHSLGELVPESGWLKPIAEGITKWLGYQSKGKYTSFNDLILQLAAEDYGDDITPEILSEYKWLWLEAEKMGFVDDDWGCYYGLASYYGEESNWEPLFGSEHLDIDTPNVKLKVIA